MSAAEPLDLAAVLKLWLNGDEDLAAEEFQRLDLQAQLDSGRQLNEFRDWCREQL